MAPPFSLITLGVVYRKFIFMVFIMIAAGFKGYIHAEKIIVDTAMPAFSVYMVFERIKFLLKNLKYLGMY